MKNSAIYIDDLHFDLERWSSELAFIKDEIKSFRKRLEEIASRYTSKDVLASLDQISNKFIRQLEVNDELQHEINQKKSELANFAKENPIALDHVHFTDHVELRDKLETDQKIFADLKKDFYNYTRKYM